MLMCHSASTMRAQNALAALYFHCEAGFSGCGSCSGSLWYPGFAEFAAENKLKATTDRIYLSLGDAESKKGSAIMRSVGEKTEQLLSVLKEKGCNTFFESNPGGHFKDADLRMAKGIRWIIS